MRITMNRDALLEKLNDRLAAAKKEDARVTAAHREEEREALHRFRENLRAAMKWNYETAKDKYFRVERTDQPACPRKPSAHIAYVIRMVTLDTRKGAFTIAEGSDLYKALTWKPESEREPETVCG